VSDANFKRRALAAVLGLLAILAVVCAAWSTSGPGLRQLGDSGARATPVAGSCGQTVGKTVRTDKSKYSHHETVRVTGSGYKPGCDVSVRVIRPDGSTVGGDGGHSARTDIAPANAAGNFSYDYHLSAMDGRYVVEVLGRRGRVLARTDFMDAFGIQKLLLNSTTGSEDYDFTAGNAVYA
jgi:hypothetical protein